MHHSEKSKVQTMKTSMNAVPAHSFCKRARTHGAVVVRLAACAAIVLVGVCSGAQAAVVIDVSQSGNNVVATVSGSFNKTGVGRTGTQFIGPDNGVRGGTDTLNVLTFDGVSGPRNSDYWDGTTQSTPSGSTTWGTAASSYAFASLNSLLGVDRLWIEWATGQQRPRLSLDTNYVSDTPISGSWTIANNTMTGLKLDNYGSYVYQFGTTPTFDTVTVNLINPVPEPSTYAMALAGLACGGCSMFRRRKQA
jgi:hypothetical protein